MASAKLDFGILLEKRHFPKAGKAPSFDSLWDEAARAEEDGFDHIWIGDSVTLLDRARGDCLTILAALAMKTATIRIGIMPLLASLRDPVLLAHALATLDVISKGRLTLAVSPGPVLDNIADQFAACGVPPKEKAGRLSESIAVMRRLWTEERFDFEGRYYRFENTGILPRPIQRPGIPIWIATGDNDTALKRVARLGEGWAIIEPDPKNFARMRRDIDAYAAEYGRPGAAAPTMINFCLHLDPDDETARENGWRWMEAFFREPRSSMGRHHAIFGSPDECAAILKPYVDAGLTALAIRIASDKTDEQMRLILDELKPRLGG